MCYKRSCESVLSWCKKKDDTNCFRDGQIIVYNCADGDGCEQSCFQGLLSLRTVVAVWVFYIDVTKMIDSKVGILVYSKVGILVHSKVGLLVPWLLSLLLTSLSLLIASQQVVQGHCCEISKDIFQVYVGHVQ